MKPSEPREKSNDKRVDYSVARKSKFGPTPGLKEITYESCELSAKEILISASAMPHRVLFFVVVDFFYPTMDSPWCFW